MICSFRQTLTFSKTTLVRDHSKARTTFRKRINTNQGGDMRKTILALLMTGLPLFVGILATHADEGGVVRFATLPPGPGHPEGIAADAKGNIYVATFDSLPNAIHIFGNNGRLLDTIPLPDAVPLGLAFDAAGNLYVANFGGGNVIKFSSPFTKAQPVVFPVCDGPPDCGLNAITFDAAGELYVSDSFEGNVFKIDLSGGSVSIFKNDELLK